MKLVDSYRNYLYYVIIISVILCGFFYYPFYQNEEFKDNEVGWIKATKLPTALSPKLNILNVTSEELKQIPAVMDAIEEVFLKENSPEEYKLIGRLIFVTKSDVKLLHNYFNEEYIEKKNTYEFYIRFAETNYSILIQLGKPLTVS